MLNLNSFARAIAGSRPVALLVCPMMALLFSASIGAGAPATELYSKLRGVMDATRDAWSDLPYAEPRDPDVSESICPLVSIPELQELYRSGEAEMDHIKLPNGDVGVPPGSERWTFFGNVLGFSREILTVYVGPKFCLALYNHMN